MEEWQICENKACPEPRQDLRAQQCAKLPLYVDMGTSRKANMTWLPFESDDRML